MYVITTFTKPIELVIMTPEIVFQKSGLEQNLSLCAVIYNVIFQQKN